MAEDAEAEARKRAKDGNVKGRAFARVIENASRLFGELRGVWFSDMVLEDPKSLEEMGRFLASEASLSGRSLLELRSLMKTYLGKNWDKSGRIRKAAEAELERHGLRFEELFAESTFQFQPGVSVPAVECCVKYGPEHIGVAPDLKQAYTTVNQGFRPHVTFPADASPRINSSHTLPPPDNKQHKPKIDMSKNTKIQWCDSTINPVMGCGGCELFPALRHDHRHGA